jgi:hypothetical protein
MRASDLQNPQVMRAHKEQKRQAELAKQREQQRDDEERREHLRDAYKARFETSVSMNRDTPWTQNVAGKRGRVIGVGRRGSGSVTFAPGSGVTIRSADGLLTVPKQYGEVSAVKTDTNEWWLVGVQASVPSVNGIFRAYRSGAVSLATAAVVVFDAEELRHEWLVRHHDRPLHAPASGLLPARRGR